MAVVLDVHVERYGHIHISEHCPERPYIEIKVPLNAQRVISVEFKTTSHDQGWCDTPETFPPYESSFTWFSVYVKRASGRHDTEQKMVQQNLRANASFHTHLVTWSMDDDNGNDHDTQSHAWLQALRAGDVIQLFARACYPYWVNVVQAAEMTVRYYGAAHNSLPIDATPVRKASSESQNYSYRRLSPARKEIRLLLVHPGEHQDPIRCDVVHRSLLPSDTGEIVNYEAISYCWGMTTDAADWKTVWVRQQDDNSKSLASSPWVQIPVQRNAEVALRQVRYKKRATRAIWLDAICIDQQNLDERSQQVGIMASIFANAHHVFIWLGESSAQTTMSFMMIRDMHNSVYGVCPGGSRCKCTGTRHGMGLDSLQQLPESPHHRMTDIYSFHRDRTDSSIISFKLTSSFGSLTAVFGNPWFRRVWVLQEVLMSRGATVLCGTESMPWRELVAVHEFVDYPGHTAMHLAPQTLMPVLWTKLLQSNRGDGDSAQHPSGKPWAPNMPFLDLHRASLGFEATDLRDMIFALLSFVSDIESKDGAETSELSMEMIRPDYKKSVQQVFADTTRWWISKYKSVAILSSIHGLEGRTWQSLHCPTSSPPPPKRPTWALGYQGKTHWAMACLESQFDFHAGGGTIVDVEAMNWRQLETGGDTLTLSLRGYAVTTVSQVTHFPLGQVGSQRKDGEGSITLVDVFMNILDPALDIKRWVSASDVGAMQEKLTSTLRSRNPSHSLLMRHIKAHCTGEFGDWDSTTVVDLGQKREMTSDETGNCTMELNREMPPCLEPCFLIAANGQIGLCPAGTREGDTVVLLFGANVPYLIRGLSGSDNQFELVGECYMEDLMNGDHMRRIMTDDISSQIFSLV